jgi:CRISPR-associated endoribonuclease Cas6
MALKNLTIKEDELNKAQKPIEWSEKPYKCIRCIFELEAQNDANIQLYNLSIPHGMLYYIIEEVDYKLAYTLHQDNNVKPWSFSRLLPQEEYKKVSNDGRYFISKGTSCLWFLNTMSPKVANAFISAQKRSLPLQFGDLRTEIKQLELEDHTYEAPPEEEPFKFIDVKLHTPTYFYSAEENKILDFSIDKLMSFQLNKLKRLGIVSDFNENELKPMVRMYRDYTDTKSCVITSFGKEDNKSKDMFGRYGKFTVKVNGPDDKRRDIWEVFHLSQFLGIGSRGSMGFGHNTLLDTH